VGEKRLRFITPPAATAITPDPIGILHGVKGERYELAKHFVEFLLTKQGQRLWIVRPGYPDGPRLRALRRPPVRRDLYADRTGWSDDVNYFEDAGGFNQRGEWMSTFAETRMIWAAAWVDSRESLQIAYNRIRRLKEPKQKVKLMAALLDLPITLEDVQEMPARMEREAQGDLQQWRARERLAWANKFRDHYEDLDDKASMKRIKKTRTKRRIQ
jgi:hypothetical protein